ncbi:MAG: PP2C family protein-serine/threonine phosphatase [Bacteroidales bacterium]|nr:PP2C family protein-serine/threonine phosphatase [Bacteroidales bacterium]
MKISTFKLNALLDITLAINENVSISELAKRFEKLLTDDLSIGKVMVIKHGEKWECLLNTGFNPGVFEKVDVKTDLLPFNEISYVTFEPDRFPEPVDIIIPVTDKDKSIAFVLIGDIEEEGEGMSPILKHLRYIQTLSNIIIVAIENKRLFSESLQQEALKREMELASKMQSMLIPREDQLPSNEHIKMFAFYHPHFEVGGDYYDVIQFNENEIGFCIADVSGKGISAAILMSNFQANLQALFTEHIPLESLLAKLNTRVMDSANGEKFITLFIARYNSKSKKLTYVNAGHNPPILYKVDSDETIQLTDGSVGMGMLDKLPFLNVQSIKMEERSKLFCFTDGLVEVLDDSGVEFGTEKLEVELQNKLSIDTNIATIIKKQGIMEGSASIFDDISILSAEFPGI